MRVALRPDLDLTHQHTQQQQQQQLQCVSQQEQQQQHTQFTQDSAPDLLQNAYRAIDLQQQALQQQALQQQQLPAQNGVNYSEQGKRCVHRHLGHQRAY